MPLSPTLQAEQLESWKRRGPHSVTCVVCAPDWLKGAAAAGDVKIAPLGYCELCAKGLPADFRPSYARYTATVQVQAWLDASAERSNVNHSAIVRSSMYNPHSVTKLEVKASRDEMLTHHRAVTASMLWFGMWFELWVYETYTSVNTPLPVHIMEFFNHG